jgi:hypothetical protein
VDRVVSWETAAVCDDVASCHVVVDRVVSWETSAVCDVVASCHVGQDWRTCLASCLLGEARHWDWVV